MVKRYMGVVCRITAQVGEKYAVEFEIEGESVMEVFKKLLKFPKGMEIFKEAFELYPDINKSIGVMKVESKI